MPRVYALLVGIDAYPAPIPPLAGCANDVRAFAGTLRRHCSSTGFELQLAILLDRQATRRALIATFARQLGAAGPEDTVVFYFSGHGSQQPTPPELWHLEPDRLDETLICWDSRLPGSWDLADKELAALLERAGARGAHCLAILDCCHAGTATRGASPMRTRGIPADQRARPLATFLAELAPPGGPTRSLTPFAWGGASGGRHVLLAACADRERAHEDTFEGESRGAFSYCLQAALVNAPAGLTYRDLHKRAAAHLAALRLPQTPELEATAPEELERVFLGARAPEALPALFTVSYQGGPGWVVDGGALHGITQRDPAQRPTLALYGQGDSPFAGGPPLRIVEIQEVRPHLSIIAESALPPAQPGATYRAVVVGGAGPPLALRLTGDAAGLAGLREALASCTALAVRQVQETDAVITLESVGQAFVIRDARTARLITRIEGRAGPEHAAVLRWLWHIERWYALVRLANPAPRRLTPASLILSLYQVIGASSRTQGSTIFRQLWSSAAGGDGDEVSLAYTTRDGVSQPPVGELRLTNPGNEPLYCALLALSEDFSVVNLLPGGCMRLDPGATVRRRIGGEVPDQLWAAGTLEVLTPLKLIVCTAGFDATLFESHPARIAPPERPGPSRGEGQPVPDPTLTNRDDWVAVTLMVVVRRPAPV